MENAINPTYIPVDKKKMEFNEDWVVVIGHFSKKISHAKAQRRKGKPLRLPEVFLCAFAPLREKSFI